MAVALWRQNLQPASFRSVGFFVRVDAKAGGRRIVEHEFPMQDAPYAEDMGRRARRYKITAYIVYSPSITPDYQTARNNLINALESDAGPGQLVHPTLGIDMVVVDNFSDTERIQEAGGISEFEIEFLEAGSTAYATPTPATNPLVGTTAQNAINTFQQSPTIAALGTPVGTVSPGNLGTTPNVTPANPLGTLG